MAHIVRDLFDEGPLLPAPEGETSNFVNPPSLGPTAAGVSITLAVLTLVFVVVRVITKVWIIKKLFLEDYLMAIAVALFFTYIGLITWGALEEGGRHIWDISVNMAIFQFHTAYIIDIVYILTMCFAKVSLLQQIRRIFSGAKRGWLSIATMVSMVCNILYSIAIVLVAINVCAPIEAFWNVLIEGKCLNWRVAFVSSSVINIISDVMILVIPVICIMRLQLSPRHKLGVAAVFATGGFSCAAAVGRLINNVQLLYADDVTYTLMSIGLWSDAEVAAAIISGCMPCMPRFFQALRNRKSQATGSAFEYRSRSSNSASYGTRSKPQTAVSWRHLHRDNDAGQGFGTLADTAELPATPLAVHMPRRDYIESRTEIRIY